MRIEKVIITNLLKNEDYTRKVIPFIKDEYFQDLSEKIIFRHIQDHISKYSTLPSVEILSINMNNDKDIGDEVFRDAIE
jgi:replicative DNA helicase